MQELEIRLVKIFVLIITLQLWLTGLHVLRTLINFLASIGRFPVQTPLGARRVIGIQPHYEAPDDFWVKMIRNFGVWLNLY